MQFKTLVLPSCVGIILLLPLFARGAGVVNNCTESDLRTAMTGGGIVTFACDGTITLASTIANDRDAVLDASGRQVTISGGNAVRVFFVASNVTFTLVNLTIANGHSTKGGAVYNQSGTVSASNCTFTGNNASAPPSTSSQGGAIFNDGGIFNLLNCVLSNNQAAGGDVYDSYLSGYGGDGQGGAIFNNGALFIDFCSFGQNRTLGGVGGSPTFLSPGAGGGAACGGAIYNSGSVIIGRSSFTNNSAAGGFCGAAGQTHNGVGKGYSGGPGGPAYGSAIYNSGSLQLAESTIAANIAIGGVGGKGGTGGSTSLGSNFGAPGGTGGGGGSGSGAIFNQGIATLINTTVALNSAGGAGGGQGGTGGSTTSSYSDQAGGGGGSGGAGGSAFGGLHDTFGHLWMTNCTFASNIGIAGTGGGGGSGGLGSGPDFPLGPTGAAGSAGTSVGGLNVVSCVFANTLLASNTFSNCSGAITDAGFNLSSDGSCAFSNVGSLNNTDPKVGPLADHGGPTLTMALLPGSPAINAGDPAAAPPTDQRGVPRPQGPCVDIGAFEYQYIPVFTDAKFQNPTNFWLQMSGLLPGQAFILQSSTNLVDWTDVTNLVAGESLLYEFVDGNSGASAARFYRLNCRIP